MSKESGNISYKIGSALDLETVIDLYVSSTLGERRPVEDKERMGEMIRNANLIVTAWDGETLVGIARTLTDFSYVAYLADLAVRGEYQKMGIGKELIKRTLENLHSKAKVVLFAAPAAEKYYPKIGFTPYPQGWIIAKDELK